MTKFDFETNTCPPFELTLIFRTRPPNTQVHTACVSSCPATYIHIGRGSITYTTPQQRVPASSGTQTESALADNRNIRHTAEAEPRQSGRSSSPSTIFTNFRTGKYLSLHRRQRAFSGRPGRSPPSNVSTEQNLAKRKRRRMGRGNHPTDGRESGPGTSWTVVAKRSDAAALPTAPDREYPIRGSSHWAFCSHSFPAFSRTRTKDENDRVRFLKRLGALHPPFHPM